MKKIKEVFKIIYRSIVYLVIGVLLYLFFAVLLAIIPVNSEFIESDGGTEIFISTNGVHTNIILPAKTNAIKWNDFLEIKENYEYFAFGWGDKEFYLNTPSWDDLKISTAFKAAFLPTQTIMQVYSYNSKPKESERVIKIILNDKQFLKICNYVAQSFKQNGKNQIVKVSPSNKYSFKEKFYLANGTYSIFNTCNNWVNTGLKQAGVKNALWAPFDKSVMYHLRK